MTFATRLKFTRDAINLTKKQAYTILGVPRATWYNYEAGTRVPTPCVRDSIIKQLQEHTP